MKKLTRWKILLFVLGLLLIIGTITAWALMVTVLKDWLIIAYGIRRIARLKTEWIVLTIIGFIMTVPAIIAFVSKLLGRLRQERQKTHWEETKQDYTEEKEKPEVVQARLEVLKAEHPFLKEMVDKCLQQMKTMDSLQEKQEALIQQNKARFLKATQPVLENVELRICRNFNSIINLCIIADDDYDDYDMEKINAYIDDNNQQLDEVKGLLKTSARWVNKYTDETAKENDEIQRWIKMIERRLDNEEKSEFTLGYKGEE